MINICSADVCKIGDNIAMLSGTSKDICFHIHMSGDRPLDADGVSSQMSISHYSDITMSPLIIKNGEIVFNDANEVVNIVFRLSPADTLNLYMGKYEYQVLIKDCEGNIDAPNHGFIFLSENNNKTFIGD